MGIFSFTDKSTMYFHGCYSQAHARDKVENYKKILRKLGINPVIAEEKLCCGKILEEAGYEKNFRKIARKNLSLLRENKIKKIIVSDPKCFLSFSADYKNTLPDWDIVCEFILETILRKLLENPKIIANTFLDQVTYYDSCYLSRSLNIEDCPRALLKLLGYQLEELEFNPKENLCCGSCGGLNITNKDLSEKICSYFIKEIKRRNIKKLIVSSHEDYNLIKTTLQKEELQEKIQVVDFSDILCKSLGIKLE